MVHSPKTAFSNELQKKYIHKSLTNKSGKWKSIALQNLARTFTKEESQELIDHLQPLLEKVAKERFNRLSGLNAPDIIMNNEKKNLDRITRSVHPDLAPLKKALKNQ